jgi:hypothetical protein
MLDLNQCPAGTLALSGAEGYFGSNGYFSISNKIALFL